MEKQILVLPKVIIRLEAIPCRQAVHNVKTFFFIFYFNQSNNGHINMSLARLANLMSFNSFMWDLKLLITNSLSNQGTLLIFIFIFF